MKQETKEKCEELINLYLDIKNEIRRQEPRLFERWKAGGFLVNSDIISMYPTLEQVVEEVEREAEADLITED